MFQPKSSILTTELKYNKDNLILIKLIPLLTNVN